MDLHVLTHSFPTRRPSDLKNLRLATVPTLSASLSPPASEQAQEPLALYVHWPFCVSKCPYCDFNSHVRAEVDMAGWRKALLADLAHEAALLPGRRLGSIFFGGGTPPLKHGSASGREGAW